MINRREFIRKASRIAGGMLIGGYLLDSSLLSPQQALAAVRANIFIAKNGSPAENVAKVIEMRFGGIENFIGSDDVVVINPNGQWPNQGATNCACCMGLIDLILSRPGGFSGEILFVENTQGEPGYWTATGSGLDRNGPYNFNDMIAWYHSQGHNNVSGFRLKRNQNDGVEWPIISGPDQGQGWVRTEWQSPTTGCLFYLPYPIIRSPYSGKLIDLKNGVYDGTYAGQPSLKFIKMPTLNNHGYNAEQDYAGITSATKSFMGIAELENGIHGLFYGGTHANMHAYPSNVCIGDGLSGAYRTGEAIAGFMQTCRKPDLFITTAEWVGWSSRTGTGAAHAKTVGLAEDPVSLDYYMSKHVLWPTYPAQLNFNPDYNPAGNNTRMTLDGCRSLGFGTVIESEMAAYVYDFASPTTFRFEIDRKIKDFRDGKVSQQEVFDLIEKYNSGN